MTRKSGYGLIALTHLGKLSGDRLASAREIAREYGIPRALLMNVMKQLSAAGYLVSVRGARGGYRLARPPEAMSMISLLESLEGPVRLADCMSNGKGADLSQCKLFERCPISRPIHELNQKMRQFLTTLTLRDIMDRCPDTLKKLASPTQTPHDT